MSAVALYSSIEGRPASSRLWLAPRERVRGGAVCEELSTLMRPRLVHQRTSASKRPHAHPTENPLSEPAASFPASPPPNAPDFSPPAGAFTPAHPPVPVAAPARLFVCPTKASPIKQSSPTSPSTSGSVPPCALGRFVPPPSPTNMSRAYLSGCGASRPSLIIYSHSPGTSLSGEFCSESIIFWSPSDIFGVGRPFPPRAGRPLPRVPSSAAGPSPSSGSSFGQRCASPLPVYFSRVPSGLIGSQHGPARLGPEPARNPHLQCTSVHDDCANQVLAIWHCSCARPHTSFLKLLSCWMRKCGGGGRASTAGTWWSCHTMSGAGLFSALRSPSETYSKTIRKLFDIRTSQGG